MVRGHPAGGTVRVTKGGTSYACRTRPLASKTSYRDPNVYHVPGGLASVTKKQRNRRLKASKAQLGLAGKGGSRSGASSFNFIGRVPGAGFIDFTNAEAIRIMSGVRKRRSDAGVRRGPRASRAGRGGGVTRRPRRRQPAPQLMELVQAPHAIRRSARLATPSRPLPRPPTTAVAVRQAPPPPLAIRAPTPRPARTMTGTLIPAGSATRGLTGISVGARRSGQAIAVRRQQMRGVRIRR